MVVVGWGERGRPLCIAEKIEQHYDEGRSKRSEGVGVGGGANGKGGAGVPSDGVVVAMRVGSVGEWVEKWWGGGAWGQPPRTN